MNKPEHKAPWSRIADTERPLWEARCLAQAIAALGTVSYDELNGEEEQKDETIRVLSFMIMNRVSQVEALLDFPHSERRTEVGDD